MKYLFTTLVLCLAICTSSFAQDKNMISSLGMDNPNATYRLFPTTNMWTFLRLNTQDGRIWQIQYDINGSNRFVSSLNTEALVSDEDRKDGRFTLYPTQNMWTFILLDTVDGRTWQVQWSQDEQNRFIIPIFLSY